MLSYNQVGAAAMLSRAAAGLVGTRALFLLPGSPKAVTLAMEALILPEAAHLLGQARRPFGRQNTDEHGRTRTGTDEQKGRREA